MSVDVRLLARLSDGTMGRYTFSPSQFRDNRFDCLKLAGEQAGAGILLALAVGAVRGWLRPSAREQVAALGRRVLVSQRVSEGDWLLWMVDTVCIRKRSTH